MPNELRGGGETDRSDRPNEGGRLERTAEQEKARQEAYFRGVEEARIAEREKSFEAAAERGLTREQWLEYRALEREDSWHAGQLEQARTRLRGGPPDYHGVRQVTPEEKQDFRDKYRDQENTALERFRSEPVEGTDNKPIDPERMRPRIWWSDGDPPIDPGDTRYRDAVVYVRPERRDWQDPRSGLGGADAPPDPRLTPEQHQEKIDEQRGHAAEVMGKERWSNSKYAGEPYDKLSEPLRERFPDGVRFSDEGFPMFDRYAKKTVVFDEGFRGPDRRDDFKRANAIFGWRKEPRDTVWHHREDGRTMILIDEKLHGEVGHWGGVRAAKQAGIWEEEPKA